MKEQQLAGQDLEREPLRSVKIGRRVAIGLKGDVTTTADRNGLDDCAVVRHHRQRLEQGFLLLEQNGGLLLGFAVNAKVGDGVAPLDRRGIDRVEGRQFEPAQEVLLHVTHAVLDAAFLVCLANIACHGFKAVMGGKVQVAGIELGLLSGGMAQDGNLQVVDHHLAGNAAKELESMSMTRQKVLHRLGERELDVEHAAVTKHHHKEGKAPASRTHGH